jgi:hypothetical protein
MWQWPGSSFAQVLPKPDLVRSGPRSKPRRLEGALGRAPGRRLPRYDEAAVPSAFITQMCRLAPRATRRPLRDYAADSTSKPGGVSSRTSAPAGVTTKTCWPRRSNRFPLRRAEAPAAVDTTTTASRSSDPQPHGQALPDRLRFDRLRFQAAARWIAHDLAASPSSTPSAKIHHTCRQRRT